MKVCQKGEKKKEEKRGGRVKTMRKPKSREMVEGGREGGRKEEWGKKGK